MLVGISGKKQSGKNTVAKIWQLLYNYYSTDINHPMRLKYKTDIEWINHVFNSDINKQSIWKQKSYAHKLKQIVCLLIGCTMEQLEDNNFKNSKLPREWETTRYRLNDQDGNFMTDWTFSEEDVQIDYEHHLENYPELFIEQESYLPTYRGFLQNVGTNALRNIIHPEIWINTLFADYKLINNRTLQDPDDSNIDYPLWLVTDVRFPDEVEAIKKRDGITIRVNRDIETYLREQKGIHIPNYLLNNKDTHISETILDEYKDFNYIIDNNGSIEDLIDTVKNIMIKENVI